MATNIPSLALWFRLWRRGFCRHLYSSKSDLWRPCSIMASRTAADWWCQSLGAVWVRFLRCMSLKLVDSSSVRPFDSSLVDMPVSTAGNELVAACEAVYAARLDSAVQAEAAKEMAVGDTWFWHRPRSVVPVVIVQLKFRADVIQGALVQVEWMPGRSQLRVVPQEHLSSERPEKSMLAIDVDDDGVWPVVQSPAGMQPSRMPQLAPPVTPSEAAVITNARVAASWAETLASSTTM